MKKDKKKIEDVFEEDLREELGPDEGDEVEQPIDDTNLVFTCPRDGKISRNDVVFLCNHCEKSELIYRDGAYMCPACLRPGENFQCMLCDSKEVKLKIKE